MTQKVIGIVSLTPLGVSETFVLGEAEIFKSLGFSVRFFAGFGLLNSSSPPTVLGLTNSKRSLFTFAVIKLFYVHKYGVYAKFLQLERSSGRGGWKAVRRLLSSMHILSSSCDVLHFVFGDVLVGKENVARAMGVKSIVSFRGYDAGIYPLNKPGVYKEALEKVSFIRVISDDIGAKVEKIAPSRSSEFFKVFQTILEKNFSPRKMPLNPNGAIKILTINRLHWKKGLDYFLNVIRKLKEAKIHVQATIVGEGGEREKLFYLIEEWGLKEDVILLGEVPNAQLSQIIQEHNFYVQTSIQEGFGNVLLEAQYMRMFTFAFASDGVNESLYHNEFPFLHERFDVDSLVKGLLEVASWPAERKESALDLAHEFVKKGFLSNSTSIINSWRILLDRC